MKERCNNPNNPAYKNYGGRGIRICDEWLKDYKVFKKWAIENGYTDDLTIDRIDNNGNYEPNNCRWVSNKVQANNRRSNVLITYKGKTQNIKQWALELGINYKTLHRRLTVYKWSIEKALTQKVKAI